MRVRSDWLAPDDVQAVLQAHATGQPCARPDATPHIAPLLTWETLDRVLHSSLPLDLVTVARGQLVNVPAPRALGDVRRLMQAGVSVVIRGSEIHDPELADLASYLGALIPGEVHVQLYATPGGTNSYGWHYDFEDVFIIQTLGVKDYYFRDNTVARHTTLGSRLDFSVFRQETSPIFSAKLVAGDWLYLPPRWWHLVTCSEDALSISVGIMGADAQAGAERLPAGWRGSP